MKIKPNQQPSLAFSHHMKLTYLNQEDNFFSHNLGKISGTKFHLLWLIVKDQHLGTIH